MPSFRTKLVTRKRKHPQQFRRGSKTFRRNKKLRQNISAKKLYTKGKQFRGGEGDTVDEVCSICLESLDDTNNKPIIITECSHTFHTQCLKNWYLRKLRISEEDESNFKLTCPNCRESPCVEVSKLIPNKEDDEAWQLTMKAKAAAAEAREEAARAQEVAERRAALRARILRNVELFIGHGKSFKSWRDLGREVGRGWKDIATKTARRTAKVGRAATRAATRAVRTMATRAVRTREVAARE